MPYLLKKGRRPHMSPSRFELREAVLKNPNGPEPVALVGGAVAAVAASTGCSTSSPELAGVAVAAGAGAAGPTGVSTNSPGCALAGVASSAQAVAA